MTRVPFAPALALALGLLAAGPAQAEFQSFIDGTCGAGCADPVSEQAAARDNWSALQTMGTTKWIGASLGGRTVDAGSLLGASRVAGASELDRWLNTGEASSTEVAQQMSSALSSGTGLDVKLITGNFAGNDAWNGQLDASSLASALGTSIGGAGGGGGGGYCDQGIDKAQNANAQRYVNAMQSIATSGDYGFSQNGGKPVQSGSPSGSGYFSGGCLEQLMQGSRDLLFRPPGLSGLLSQLGGMFGGGGGGAGGGAAGCAAAPSVMSQVTKSMPQSIFSGGNGGFLPAAAFGGGGLMGASGLSSLGGAQMASPRGIASLLGR
jgi:hypothetical protein